MVSRSPDDDVVYIIVDGDHGPLPDFDDIPEQPGIRHLRWSELVAMTLHDARLSAPSDWGQVLGSQAVPPSPEVRESEHGASEKRLEAVDDLAPILQSIMQILSVPAVTNVIGTLGSIAGNEEQLSEEEAMSRLAQSVMVALHLCTTSTISVLVNLGILSMDVEIHSIDGEEEE